MSNLTEGEVRLLKKISNIITLIALLLLIPSAISIFIGNLFLEPILYFPIILSSVFLFYAYKFNVILKNNNGIVSHFKLKLILLSYARSIFLSLVYLTVVVESHFGTVFFLFLTITTLVCQINLKRYDK